MIAKDLKDEIYQCCRELSSISCSRTVRYVLTKNGSKYTWQSDETVPFDLRLQVLHRLISQGWSLTNVIHVSDYEN